MPNRFFYSSILFLLTMLIASVKAEQPADPDAPADYDIGTKTVVYFDKSRERPIITEFYYPAKQNLPPLPPTSNNFKLLHEQRDAPTPSLNKKLPLILVSHAYQGNRHAYAWLQEFLAANGYIVAAPDHYGCTSYIPRPEECIKPWERPTDIGFLIEKILNDDFFKEWIDPEKIGFIGYELGSLTGIWLAGGIANNYPNLAQDTDSIPKMAQDIPQAILEKTDFSKAKKSYENKKIKAMLLIHPIYSFVFNREGLSSIEIPISILSSKTNDSQFFSANIQGAKVTTFQHLWKNSPHQSTLSPETIDEADQEEIASIALNFFNTQFK